MLRIVIEVDKDPWDLTRDELEGLEYDSISDDQYSRMPENFMRSVPLEKLVEKRDFSTVSYKTVLSLLRVNLYHVSNTSYYYDTVVSDALLNWCSTDFIQKNFVSIIRHMDDTNFQRTWMALIEHGVVNINDVNLSFHYIKDKFLNSTSISIQERKTFLKSTNYLCKDLSDYGSEDFVVLLPCQDLKDLNLPAPEYSINTSDIVYYIDINDVNYLNSTNKDITWDSVVEMFYSNKITYRTVAIVWDYIFGLYTYGTTFELKDSGAFYIEGLSLTMSKEKDS